ncbi:MAG: NAD-dependent epimerase/dehydratase family protein [Candidatus Omnitrophica bacterium]|nr:NAD-dependent epimerase/dehydratase family protein [Candidatus Omnitrophota bacterium]
MSVVIVTGSGGLVGSETVSFFCEKNFDVVGIDNDMRKFFFGRSGSVIWNLRRLKKKYNNYLHYNLDIRDEVKVNKVFKRFGKSIVLIVHSAAQPSHDWAAKEPHIDFSINATATVGLLEAYRKYCPDAVFIFVSTNKVYGDRPNYLPFVEMEKRFEIERDHRYYNGIDESMNIDNSLHSLFGASKLAADILTQEYGRYFGLKTAIFRCGCISGPMHSGTELHGFLSYLVRCLIMKKKYIIYGYKGKQVRDNIHSYDLVNAFYYFFKQPRCGEVYNIGGGRFANVSILEAIDIYQEITKQKIDYGYVEQARRGDHIWWITDISKFTSHYPQWSLTYTIEDTLREIYTMQQSLLER